jgi:hypothetical protein
VPVKRSTPSDDKDLDSDDGYVKKRGRPVGAGNYLLHDLKMLLDCTEGVLPLGQNGWKKVASRFAKRAAMKGRPTRDAASLEKKFKRVRFIPLPYCSLLLTHFKACKCSQTDWDSQVALHYHPGESYPEAH